MRFSILTITTALLGSTIVSAYNYGYDDLYDDLMVRDIEDYDHYLNALARRGRSRSPSPMRHVITCGGSATPNGLDQVCECDSNGKVYATAGFAHASKSEMNSACQRACHC